MTVAVRRAWLATVALSLVIATGCGVTPDEGGASPNLNVNSGSSADSHSPVGVVGLGHSGMTGTMSDPNRPGVDAWENSWATGTAADINSVYQRLVEARPETERHFANFASNGAQAATLAAQAMDALKEVPKPELVLIQTIDNDIRCDGSDPAHIPEFGAAVAAALTVITAASPNSRILLVSQLGRPATYAAAVATDPAAAASMGGTGMCDFFDSDGNLNQEHLATLTGIVEAYEAEQARVCAEVPQCSGDEGAFATYVDEIDDLIPGDWTHLTAHGHARAAETIWPAVEQVLGLT